MNLTDKELVNALYQKFEEKEKALYDLKMLNKKLEETNLRLLESEKLKSSFLSNIKNEINNPMASLIGLCEEIRGTKPGDKERDSTVAESILSEALNLDFQLRNILMAAEFESGDTPLNIVKMDINSVIDTCVGNLRHLMKEKDIQVRKTNDNSTWINTDPDKLCIIISNLLSNAIIFNKEGGRVEIEVEVISDVFFISVRDTGIGIKKEDQSRIFDRFMQIDRGATKRFRGHGLGLSVAKAAANLLNGDISLVSYPGSGSRFTVILPALSGAQVENVYVDGVEYFSPGGEVETEL